MIPRVVSGSLMGAVCLFFLALLVPMATGADDPGASAPDQPAGMGLGVLGDEFDEEFGEGPEAAAAPEAFDPLGRANRFVFVVNDKLYFWVLKPTARGYAWVVTEGRRVCVKRFFDNLRFPIRFVNDVLQCKLRNAGMELARFGVNSSVGILGLYDPAQSWLGLAAPLEEDFGQTLGHYGVGEGFTLMLPILGPSNARDAFGLVVDYFLNPVSYLDPWWVYYGCRSVEKVNDTSLRIGEYESFKKQALDPYTFMRDAYGQYRAKQVEE